ncbi:MAG: phage tail family protein [Eubacteriales bacterium]|nr:phage tail family protein [Eubacteriales bacterium]
MIRTKSLKIYYENEIGQKASISFGGIYHLIDFSEDLQNSITTSKQNLIHGTKFISNTLGERSINIEIAIFNLSENINAIYELRRIFNPALKGILTAEENGKKRNIEVCVESLAELKKEKGYFKYSINLIACNPFWEDEVKTEYLAMLTPTLKFPLVIPQKKGITFGRRRSVLESEVENIGDVESGFKVIFKAKGGTVKNPKIYDVYSNNFIKINYTMEKGDILEVINYPEIKKITLNGAENAFKYLDVESNFFNLKIGNNKIGYIADENTINLDVILWYAPRYLGVF